MNVGVKGHSGMKLIINCNRNHTNDTHSNRMIYISAISGIGIN